MEQEIVVWGIICGGRGEQEEKSNHNLKGLVWRAAIYQRMRLKALSFFLSPHSPPSGSRVVEAEQRRKERTQNLKWLERCCHRFTYSMCSLAKRGFNMKSTGCHMTLVTACFYFIFKAKWHFKLLAFTNEHVSKTLQRADKFQISFNFWQRYIWLPLKKTTHLVIPLCFDNVSAKSTSELVDKGWKLTLNDTW